jgi:SAM-dependent methyltransferase
LEVDVKLLNIGCGANYHPAWVNVDFEPISSEILRHDVITPLPFEASRFDACYCSHVIEHLSPDEARLLMAEIHRVLKPGGIARIVVPDLEGIVRTYLTTLEQALLSAESAEFSYDWILLELLDQLARNTSGGQMGQFLKKCPLEMREFISGRIGKEAEYHWVNGQQQASIFFELFRKPPMWFVCKIRFLMICCFAWLLGGKRGLRSVKEGWFRTSGEVHRWMYDQFSLGRLLREAGFNDVVICAPKVSRIHGFSAYELDVTDGMVRKPDSLFMEGVCS